MNNLTQANQAQRSQIRDRVIGAIKPAIVEQVNVSAVFKNDPFPIGTRFELNPIEVNVKGEHHSLTYSVGNVTGRYSDYDGSPMHNFQLTCRSPIADQVVVVEGLHGTHEVWNAIIDNIQELEA